MICHDNLRKAEEMEVSPSYALACRRRYLTRRLWEIEEEDAALEAGEVLCPDINCPLPVCERLCQICHISAILVAAEAEREWVHREIWVIDKLLVLGATAKGGVTGDMIERARAYPVAELVAFHRGKAQAWCHDDRNPSLFHGTRANVAVCPVCDKRFDAIEILRTRDGLSFQEAVRQLNNR